MEKESSEISLDEVLSSIRDMVTNEEPPVLELTEMVSEDGSIVSLKNTATPSPSDKKNTDMSAFLKLIQQESGQNLPNNGGGSSKMSSSSKKQSSIAESSDSNSIGTKSSSSNKKSPKNQLAGGSNKATDYNDTIFQELVIDTAKPLIEDWIRNNLEQIVKATVQAEVRSLLNKKRK